MTTRPRSSGQKRILASLLGLPLTEAASAYLASRGLLEVATDLGIGVVPGSADRSLQPYVGRLCVPSIGPRGNVYDVAFRCIQDHDCRSEDCPKYLFLPGMDKRLYNLQALTQAGDVIDITEGQLDAASLAAIGYHAVGVPGVENWKPHHRRLFLGFGRVRVWGDGDKAGREFAKRVCHDVAEADVMMLPSGEDINSLLIKEGPQALREIAESETANDD